MEKYTIPFEVKQVSENDDFYFIEGIISTTEVDLGDDVVVAGAIVESVKRLGMPAFRSQHNQEAGPIGVIDEVEQIGEQTRIKSRLPKRDEEGKLLERFSEIYALAKMKAYKGLSIGYGVLERTFKDAIRILEKINVIEMSLVDFPMNQGAILTGVKSADTLKKIEEAEKLSDIEDILHSAEFSNKGTLALISKIKELKSLSDSGDSQRDSEKADFSEILKQAKSLKTTMEK